MVEFYLANNPYMKGIHGMSELEVRFGTNPKNTGGPLRKICLSLSCL
jgi:hypothetical protein